MSGPALWPTQPNLQWVLGLLTQGVKQPAYEADHSLSFSARLRIHDAITPALQFVSMTWCLINQ